MFRYFIRNRTFWLKILVICLVILLFISYLFKDWIKNQTGFTLPDEGLFEVLLTLLGLLFVFNQEYKNKIDLEDKRPILEYEVCQENILIKNNGLATAKDIGIYDYNNGDY